MKPWTLLCAFVLFVLLVILSAAGATKYPPGDCRNDVLKMKGGEAIACMRKHQKKKDDALKRLQQKMVAKKLAQIAARKAASKNAGPRKPKPLPTLPPRDCSKITDSKARFSCMVSEKARNKAAAPAPAPQGSADDQKAPSDLKEEMESAPMWRHLLRLRRTAEKSSIPDTPDDREATADAPKEQRTKKEDFTAELENIKREIRAAKEVKEELDPEVFKALLDNWEKVVQTLTDLVTADKSENGKQLDEQAKKIAALQKQVGTLSKESEAKSDLKALKNAPSAPKGLQAKLDALKKEFDDDKKDREELKKKLEEVTKIAEFSKKEISITNKKVKLNAMKIGTLDKKLEGMKIALTKVEIAVAKRQVTGKGPSKLPKPKPKPKVAPPPKKPSAPKPKPASGGGANIIRDTLFMVGLKERNYKKMTGQKIRWDKILANPGKNYNEKSGVYTAPLSGYYQFSALVSSWDKKCQFSIYVGMARYASRWLESTTQKGSGMLTTTIKLKAGDQVSVLNHGPSAVYGTDEFKNMESFFTGFMLAPLK